MKTTIDSCWVLRCGLLSALFCLHCGNSDPNAPASAGASASVGVSAGSDAGGMLGSGDSAGSSTGGAQDYGGATETNPGGNQCGFGDLAAFCDSFDAPAAALSRAGELDPSKWSGSRVAPQFPTAIGAVGIGTATIPSCRSGISATASPDGDALICNPNDAIASNHLLVAVGAQNYGQNSYRIRQPFDFADRTGKIVFDADGTNVPLYGWVSLDVTEDPIPGPGFDTGPGNDEGNQVPKNGFEVQFQTKCDGVATVPSVGLRFLAVFNEYKATFMAPTDVICMTTQKGNLNHFEVTVSKNKIEVFGTDYSADGKTFATPKLIYSAAVNLPFTRGHVNITTHNHATIKYSVNVLDAWVAAWDNVGFDGPVISDSREYEIPDSLTTFVSPENRNYTNIGYRVADAAGAPSDTLHFSGVDLEGMSSAHLALSAWYLFSDSRDVAVAKTYALRYRFNGGAWHDRQLNDAEATMVSALNQGSVAEMIDVPLEDLVSGDNSVEFLSVNAPQNYPPAVSNINLILSK